MRREKEDEGGRRRTKRNDGERRKECAIAPSPASPACVTCVSPVESPMYHLFLTCVSPVSHLCHLSSVSLLLCVYISLHCTVPDNPQSDTRHKGTILHAPRLPRRGIRECAAGEMRISIWIIYLVKFSINYYEKVHVLYLKHIFPFTLTSLTPFSHLASFFTPDAFA